MDAKYNEKGEEMPDNTPVELPIGYSHPEDLQSMIRRMVSDAAFIQAQDAAGVDTEEEADDFDVMDEEPVAPSNYEYTEMQEEQVKIERANRQRATESVPQPVDKQVSKKGKAKGKPKAEPVKEPVDEDVESEEAYSS